MNHPLVSLEILGIAAVTLCWMAITDFREFRIRNEQILVLAALYFAFALASGTWTSMPWNIGFAALVGAIAVYAYSLQQMGGGDMKLLTVAALWIGPGGAVPFSVLLIVFVMLHYGAARLGWVASKRSAAGVRLPLAPSVAAALLGVFALGLFAPVR